VEEYLFVSMILLLCALIIPEMPKGNRSFRKELKKRGLHFAIEYRLRGIAVFVLLSLIPYLRYCVLIVAVSAMYGYETPEKREEKIQFGIKHGFITRKEV